LDVCRWKTPRSKVLTASNSAEAVEAATGEAVAGADDRLRMSALRRLGGVDWPTASVFLHVIDPDRYPILDRRALQALGVGSPVAYSFSFWQAYVEACRHLAGEAGVDGRTFDRALWQWSKEQGVPI
jgi:hypothetical protein